jgi:hypothetical protein
MTVTRRHWRGVRDSSPNAPRVEAVDAFGWIVHKHSIPHGGRLILVSTADVERARAPNLAIYTAGRGVVVNDRVGAMPDRVPGMCTGERPDHPAGTTTITADGRLELWCFNWHANRGALPAATPLRCANAESVELQAGQRVLLCAGALGDFEPGPFVAPGGPLAARGDVYGFLIEGERG